MPASNTEYWPVAPVIVVPVMSVAVKLVKLPVSHVIVVPDIVFVTVAFVPEIVAIVAVVPVML